MPRSTGGDGSAHPSWCPWSEPAPPSSTASYKKGATRTPNKPTRCAPLEHHGPPRPQHLTIAPPCFLRSVGDQCPNLTAVRYPGGDPSAGSTTASCTNTSGRSSPPRREPSGSPRHRGIGCHRPVDQLRPTRSHSPIAPRSNSTEGRCAPPIAGAEATSTWHRETARSAEVSARSPSPGSGSGPAGLRSEDSTTCRTHHRILALVGDAVTTVNPGSNR